MPVPQSLSQPPEEPSPGASLLRRDSVLARLPSLQGKGFTPEVRSSHAECNGSAISSILPRERMGDCIEARRSKERKKASVGRCCGCDGFRSLSAQLVPPQPI